MWYKIKRIYQWENLVYPRSYTPNSNTLLYLPFDWNLNNDQWKTITWSWIAYEKWWVNKVVKLTDTSGSITWPWNLMSSVWTGDYAVSLWIKPTNWGNPKVFGNWYESWVYPWVEIYFIFWTAFSVTNKVIARFADSNNIPSTMNATTLVWSWHNIVVTRISWTNYLYIDNVLQWQLSWWASLANSNYLIILNRWGTGQSWTNTWALMDELIVENKWWTATDVSNYYSVAQQFYTS